MGDLALVTVVLWLSRDPQSEYYLLYYVPILHTGVRLRPRDGAAAAVLSSALYVFVLVTHASGHPYLWLAVLRSVNLLAPATILVIFVMLLKRESEVSYSLRQALHDSLRRFAAVYDVAHAANTGAGSHRRPFHSPRPRARRPSARTPGRSRAPRPERGCG